MSTRAAAEKDIDVSRALIRRLLDFARDEGLSPGERLPAERVLAERLGVSRNALREALTTLETLRVVESRPNSGIYLRAIDTESSFETIVLLAGLGATPTPSEVRETIEVRATLEAQAVTLACARRDDADLARLAANLEETDRVLAAGGNIADCDQAFHIALANAGHNSVLVRMLHAFYVLTLPRRRLFFADAARGAASTRTHRLLVAAVAARDARRAATLMARHLGNAQVYWAGATGPVPVRKARRD